MFLKLEKTNNGRVKFITDSIELENHIRNHFLVKNPVKRFVTGSPSMISPISLLGSFVVGLSKDVLALAKGFSSDIKFFIDPEIMEMIRPFSYETEELVNVENEKFQYREYQSDSIHKGLKNGRGIFELATSAGKSLIIYGLIKNIWKQKNEKLTTLILVPTLQLVTQMGKDFTDYGCDPNEINFFSSFSHDLTGAKIIISNRQWLQNHAEELPNIDMVIVDECHTIALKKNNSTKYVMNLKTNIKFGFTGTLPNDKFDLWTLKSILGSILLTKKSMELQDEGYIAKTNFVVHKFVHSCQPPKPPLSLSDEERAKLWFPLEWRFIEANEKVNNYIARFVTSLEGNSILLFDHNDHGQYIFDAINFFVKTDRRIFFINGETELDIREDIRQDMEKYNNCILVANTGCFKMGVNIKNIDNILFCFSFGKKAQKIIQSVGRGLRIKEGKDKMNLFDFYHNFRYSNKHFLERMILYEENYTINKMIKKEVNI